ncbi:MAG: diacylglycerol kinase family lipid kinase [Bacteroidia bacterium]|nr:diacylglycerol kinase family lipid kinase [Bacteroidia bacterium]
MEITPDHWFVVVNPQSGGGKAKRKWPMISTALGKAGILFASVFTQKQEDAITLVKRAIEKGYRRVIAVGGDGTVSEVINGILSQKTVPGDQVVFAVIPIGSGNDWARMYGISRNPHKSILLLQNPVIVVQDAGRITWVNSPEQKVRYFNNIAGFLFEAFLTEKTLSVNKTGVAGQFVYLLSLLKYMFRFRSSEITVNGDDFSEKGVRLLVTAGICRYNGGGMSLVPLSLPGDGFLDITVADEIPPWEILRNILKIYNGKIYTHPKIRHYRTRSLFFEDSGGLPVEADGEVLAPGPVKIELLPQALRIVVPPDFRLF